MNSKSFPTTVILDGAICFVLLRKEEKDEKSFIRTVYLSKAKKY